MTDEGLEREEIGTRVGAILSSDVLKKHVKFLGYGSYLGDEVPVGAEGVMASLLAGAGVKNPKIHLDSGQTVWGCECWWGPEEEVKDRIAEWKDNGYTIEVVNIETERHAYREKGGEMNGD